MKAGRQTLRHKRRAGAAGSGRRAGSGLWAGLAAHPAFAPIMGLWGAALAGLVILVLPAAAVTSALEGTGLAALGARAQLVLAGGGAVVLGCVLFIIAYSLPRSGQPGAGQPRADDRTGWDEADAAPQPLRPIDPALDLGSLSFDDPLDHMPFAASAIAAEADLAPPLALDLAEFAELPGRNAVWVEAPATAELAPAPAFAPAPEQPEAQSALARLRAVPPGELSTVQMVERFAAALQDQRAQSERQNGGQNGGRGAHPSAKRAAALAEALKALAAMSRTDAAQPAPEPLQNAIARLQQQRGAA
jgi:hypothetical protein